ncbi:MAG: PAS domain S-box protein [Bauldia sp.]|nr:PAS domain S-box protein [Bauldia sp.]
MDGCTYSYLDLTGLPVVGAVLLDARPAFVASADVARLLWANAAAVTFFGERQMSDLIARRFSDLNPLKAQLARLSRLLPSESDRVEILRIGRGVGLATLPAACRRLNLDNEARAVLAVAADGAAAELLVARAERLVDTIGSGNCLAAVLTGEGKVIAASGGFEEFMPVEPAIDRMISTAQASSERTVKVSVGRHARRAGTARFKSDKREYLLLIVGAAEETPAIAEPEQLASERKIDVAAETPIEVLFPALEEEPVEAEPESPPSPVVTFVWEMDGDGRFVSASPELAAAVGERNAAVVGRRWDEVARVLDLDPEGTVATKLAGDGAFAATVYWPVTGESERVAIDLTALPVVAGERRRVGFRGFGACRLDDRQPDQRTDRVELSEAGTAAPAPPIAEQPRAPPTGEHPITRDHDDLDNAARKSIEEGPLEAETALPPRPSNIVRLPGAQPTRTPPEKLSGTEREAFRRIAEALGTQRQGKGQNTATPRTEPSKPAAKESAKAADIDARLLDRLPIGIAVFRDRKTLFANRTLLDLLDYDSHEAFIAAGGAEAIFPGSEGVAGNIAESGGRLAASRRDGTTLPVKAWLHAVTFAGATALMLSISAGGALAGDDEDELAAELAGSAARAEELEAILDTATDGVVVIDGRGKIGSMNRAAEALFGVNAGEYLGRYFTDLLADESQKAALDYLDGLAANGVASVLNDGREVIGRVPRGGLIPLFMTMGRIADRSGGSDKFCAVLRDITHWKNVEQELIAARRQAEAANQQKSDFLAKISHEIRTPLNAIIGFSEVMMEERFGPIGNTRYRDYLHDIHVSGAHLMSLINDLLDLSKIEAGKLDRSFEAVPVNAIIQECVALMQPQANRERIIIRTSLSLDVPNVVADVRSFRQILLNLLSNAIKFTRAGGQVIVSTALEASGEAVVRIRDTGIGMSEKDIETALKPFRQVAVSREDREHGTGLGLPLTKALVEANRAIFSIESALNQGTLVKITFPTTRVLAG